MKAITTTEPSQEDEMIVSKVDPLGSGGFILVPTIDKEEGGGEPNVPTDAKKRASSLARSTASTNIPSKSSSGDIPKESNSSRRARKITSSRSRSRPRISDEEDIDKALTLSKQTRRDMKKSNSYRDFVTDEDGDTLKERGSRRHRTKKSNSLNNIDMEMCDSERKPICDSEQKPRRSRLNGSRSKNRTGLRDDRSKNRHQENEVDISADDLFSPEGMQLLIQSVKPPDLDTSMSKNRGSHDSNASAPGESGMTAERRSTDSNTLEQPAQSESGSRCLPDYAPPAKPTGSSIAMLSALLPSQLLPSPMRRSLSIGKLDMEQSNKVESTGDRDRVERLEVQKNLYKEQFKVIVKEKKELIGMHDAEIAAKNELVKQFQEEIEALKLENGKLKANLAKGGTGSTGSARSLTKKAASSSSCYVSADSTVLMTSYPRPRPAAAYLPGLRSLPYWTQFNQELCTTDVAFKDPSLSWAVMHFETYWGDIADEYQRVAPFIPSDLNAESAKLGPKLEGEWSWHSFVFEGTRNNNFLQHFPRTCDLLNDVREKGLLFEKTPFAHTYFSTLSKNSRLSMHNSPINFRIRLYLPLLVPGDHFDMSCYSEDSLSATDQVGIRVGATARGWQTGRCILVDDSYDHQLWNNESSAFVCFVVDLWHPDIMMAERKELVEFFEGTRSSDWIKPSVMQQ